MKKLLPFLCLLCAISAQAQMNISPLLQLPMQLKKNTSNKAIVGGSYEINSPTLNNRLVNEYLNHNYLDEDAKTSVIPRLRANNHFGAYAESYLYDAVQLNSRSWLYFGWKYRYQGAGRFSEDMYKLLGFGNAVFAGQTAQFGNSSFDKTIFHDWQVGMIRTLGKEDKYMLGGGLSIIAGNNGVYVDIPRGSLYTSYLGDSVVLDSKMSINRVQPVPGFFNYQGFGLALNAFGSAAVGKHGAFQFAVADAGFLKWGASHAQVFNLDYRWTYTGAEASLINNQFTVTGFSTLPDSLSKDIKNGGTHKAYNVKLPMQIELMYTQELSKKLSLLGGIEYFAFARHLPQVYVLANQSIGKWLKVDVGANAGGYGVYGIMLGAGADYKGWALRLGTSHLEAYLSQDNTGGQGLFFSLSRSNMMGKDKVKQGKSL